jgi:hypothetical protein
MVTPRPNTNPLIKRPVGIVVVESYFLTLVAFLSFRLIADLDFYTRRASSLPLPLFVFRAKILELIICLLCAFAVVGLQRMRPWGRWLAIVLAGAGVAFTVWFCLAVVIFRLWTLVPHHIWPYVRGTIELGFGVYIVWYLFQPIARCAFRPLQPPAAGTPD